jgi:DNA-binding winged helix-turn-helix (wHTH) protein
LRRESQLVRLDPQVFDLLIYLIENRHRVVSKGDMLAAVWAGRIVSESTLASRINAAPNAIGDNGKDQTLIRTVPRKGFRFVADVRVPSVVITTARCCFRATRGKANHSRPQMMWSPLPFARGGAASVSPTHARQVT